MIDLTAGKSTPSKPAQSSMKMIDYVQQKEKVTKAEIIWCLHCVFKHTSFRSCADAVKIFPLMFEDSEIAKNMKMCNDKVGYNIVHGLAPYFEKIIRDMLQNADYLVVGFDEAFNKVAKKQQMDLAVRFWDNAENEVKTRYLTSAFLESSKAVDLGETISDTIGDNLKPKMIQVSMDGPNVNFCMLDGLKIELSKNNPDHRTLLDIGSCGLHIVHGAFKTAFKSLGWFVMEFFKSLYYLLSFSPTRRGIYRKITSSNTFPSKFCMTRWVENKKVAKRSLEMLPFLIIWVAAIEKEGKESAKRK